MSCESPSSVKGLPLSDWARAAGRVSLQADSFSSCVMTRIIRRSAGASARRRDVLATGGGIDTCSSGYAANYGRRRSEHDRTALSCARLSTVYRDNLIEVTEWCL